MHKSLEDYGIKKRVWIQPDIDNASLEELIVLSNNVLEKIVEKMKLKHKIKPWASVTKENRDFSITKKDIKK